MVDLEIVPEDGASKKIVLRNIPEEETITIGMEDIPTENISFDQEIAQSYAINLEGFNFTNGTLTVTAKGTELYKCPTWNFTARTCPGNWVRVMSLVPGQEYSVDLFPGHDLGHFFLCGHAERIVGRRFRNAQCLEYLCHLPSCLHGWGISPDLYVAGNCSADF